MSDRVRQAHGRPPDQSVDRAIANYIKRCGARFPCGCVVRRQAYVTIQMNASKPGRLPGFRIRCQKHHRINCARRMAELRAENR